MRAALLFLCLAANAAAEQQQDEDCAVNFLQESSELAMLRLPDAADAAGDEEIGLQLNATVDVKSDVQQEGHENKQEDHDEQSQEEKEKEMEDAEEEEQVGEEEEGAVKASEATHESEEETFSVVTGGKADIVNKAVAEAVDPDREVHKAIDTGPQERDINEGDCQRLVFVLLAVHAFRCMLHCLCGAKLGMVGVALSLLVHSALILTYLQEDLFQDFVASFETEVGVPGDLCWWCWVAALMMIVGATVVVIDLACGMSALHSQ